MRQAPVYSRSASVWVAPLPWTLTGVSLAIGLHAQQLPLWVLGAFGLLALWRLLIAWRRVPAPSRALRAIAVAVVVLAVAMTFRTINGVDAGTALLTLMAGLKLLETRSARDHRLLALTAYFLVLASFLYGQHVWQVPLAAIVVWFITAALLKAGEPQSLAPQTALLLSGRVMLLATPLMLVLFLLFPRIPGPFWALSGAERAVTGLGEEMAPGDISELSVSSDVAFRVRFAGTPPPPALRYWRGPVLHDFDGYTWRRARGVIHPQQPVTWRGRAYDYTLMLEPTGRRWVFALDMPESWPTSRYLQTYDYPLLAADAIDQPLTVQLRSRSQYTAGTHLGASMRRRDLRLPPDTNPRTRALAAEMHTSAGNDVAYMNAVLRMFREQAFSYTLTPPRLDFNSVDDFLFNTRSGFCGHFASAFTTMMRAAGIPARVVTGYQGGELNRLTDYYIVRQSDAHAWSEIWLEGRGWVRVDPTAAVAPERIERGLADALGADEPVPDRLLREFAWLRDVRFAWDAVNTLWRERVVEFNQRSQERLLEWLGFSQPDWRTLGMLLAFGVVLVLGTLGMQLGRELRVRDVDPVQRAYARFCRRLERRGLSRSAHEGPSDFAMRVRAERPDLAEDCDVITRIYLELRYGRSAATTALDELSTRVRAFHPARHPA
jgi:transglutaminase-like putative cysteine protease